MITITDALRGEHGVLAFLFNHIEASVNQGATAAQIRLMLQLIEPALRQHGAIEDELIAPALVLVPEVTAALAMMQLEHKQLDEQLARLWSCDELQISTAALRFIEGQRRHLHNEETFLYTLIDEFVPRADLERLGAEWVGRRGLDGLSEAR